jgi:acetyl esterase
MRYASGIEQFVERANKVLPLDYHTRPVPEQRELYRNLIYEFPFGRPPGIEVTPDTLRNSDRQVPVLVYRPINRRSRGAYLFFHGGGFVLGSLETHDSLAAELAAGAGLTVIAVDFRLAPEHPFPAALHDCYDALCGLVDGQDRLDIDPTRIGVAGDSSGANLAIALSLFSRDRGGPGLRAQALVSPVGDFARWQGGGDDAALLSSDEMVFFTHCYVSGDVQALEGPYVSPLRSARFDHLPPAYIMAASEDSLCVDSVEYAARLREAGVPVELVIEKGLVHACVRARDMSPEVADAWARFCAAAGRLLHPEAA